MAQEPNNQGGEPTGEISIIQAETGTAFFIRFTGTGYDDLKAKVKEIGGTYNGRVRAWKFPVSQQEEVNALLAEYGAAHQSLHMVDPNKIITVEFTQRFQWPGDMAQAEERLKQLGMVRKAGPKQIWTADLSKATPFLNAFGISQ
jgi:hypothetical protein